MSRLARGVDTEPPADGAARQVTVALVGRAGDLDALTYAIPDDLVGSVRPGVWVSVPLGPRHVTGVVIGPSPAPPRGRVRPIAKLLAEAPAPPDLLELATWAARYYELPLAALLRAVLPPSVRGARRRHVRLGPKPCDAIAARAAALDPGLGLEGLAAPDTRPGAAALEPRILARIPPEGLDYRQLVAEIGPAAVAVLRRLAARGAVEIAEVDVERRAERAPVRATPGGGVPAALARAPRQLEVLEYARARAPHPLRRSEIEDRFPGTSRIVDALLRRGLLDEVQGEPPAAAESASTAVELGPEQADAARAIASATGFAPFLLFGVTGSGKTEVYLRAAAEVRRRGESVLILVPEIGLTDQLVVQARRRFPGEIAVLHSGLREAERARAWHDVASGRLPIVVGARSALFAPLAKLGLIVVDEEHDAAYKQEEAPRYNARDLAVVRAKLAGCAVVLASATPSLESYSAARDGRYRLLRLGQRANLSAMPEVELIDLRAEARRAGAERVAGSVARETATPPRAEPQILSGPLAEAIVDNYRAGGQTLLFLNRRGFARFIQCEACGRVETCPHCSVSLTEHRARRVAVCHHCGFAQPPAARCPDCANPLAPRSFGTEQIESAAHDLLPSARIARLDRDTGSSAEAVHRTLAAWRAKEIDLLIGTQMVAKGHDAPGVTLIGVVLADASLNFPDFRAAERTFQLLAQVAGRAGRGSKPGRVLIQTRQPDHPSLIAARAHDFEAFARRELELRAELGYPPYGRLTRIVIEGEAEASERRAADIARRLRAAAAGGRDASEILGPAPAPIEKLRGRYRHQVLLKSRSPRAAGRLLVAAGLAGGGASRDRSGVRTIIDVDPVNML